MQITFFQHHEITLQLSGGEEFIHMESKERGGSILFNREGNIIAISNMDNSIILGGLY